MMTRYGKVPPSLDMNQDGYDPFSNEKSNHPLAIEWWSILKVIEDNFKKTLKPYKDILPPVKSYENSLMYGDYDKHDLHIFFNEYNYIQEVSGRLDLRDLTKDIIDLIIVIASNYDCFLMDVKGDVFAPKTQNILNSVKVSNAFKFVENPQKFLSELDNNQILPK
ncbi:MAG: hypothetical protein EOO20_26535 [Chryseobacterium sp.]|nr:MAG: hypothetical protein EOO20_26535 [Chryseobacterium sp.]